MPERTVAAPGKHVDPAPTPRRCSGIRCQLPAKVLPLMPGPVVGSAIQAAVDAAREDIQPPGGGRNGVGAAAQRATERFGGSPAVLEPLIPECAIESARDHMDDAGAQE